jgi:hypothetical protein
MLMLSACATMPTGPSVNVLPAPGKPFEVFAKEDGTCRQWAQSQIGNSTQDTYDKSAVTLVPVWVRLWVRLRVMPGQGRA